MTLDANAPTVAALGALSYLLGGLPVGWLLVRATHQGLDVRQLGSGNVGTSNIFRNVDAGLAVLVGPAQFLQGLIPVLVAELLGMPVSVQALVGVCAVIGNGWPVWLGFNGGRGIAVATGVVAALSPPALLPLLLCYAVLALRRQIAAGVLLGFALLPLVGTLLGDAARARAFAALFVIVVLRRLEGVVADVRRSRDPWAVVARRIVRDERPGRPLVGRRTDASPGG